MQSGSTQPAAMGFDDHNLENFGGIVDGAPEVVAVVRGVQLSVKPKGSTAICGR